MTKLLIAILCAAALWPLSVEAGTLYGTVRVGSTPAAGVGVSVACPGFGGPGRPPPATGDATTDTRGSYSLRVEANGPCKMRLQRDGRTGPEFDVFVANNSLRLDVDADTALGRVR